MQSDLELSDAAEKTAPTQDDQPAPAPVARRQTSAVTSWLREQLREHHPNTLRQMAEIFVSELIEAEIDKELGPASSARLGGRPRRWAWRTRIGIIQVSIPRLRSGSAPPDWLQRPRRGSERVVLPLLMLACIRDV